jgi:tRNA modification GTPase
MHTQTGDTICALSTPPGKGAIAVIRVSGPGTFGLCDRFFRPAKKDHFLSAADSHTIHYGFFGEGETILDEVLVSVFRAPHSYTGEEVAEISVHGSLFIQQNVLRLLISGGARLADPGEFTLRAFMNGKFDLSQAEAVADLIAAGSQSSHDLAIAQMRGGFSKKIRELRQKLLDFTALIELELDFSEEEVEFASRPGLSVLLDDLESEIIRLLNSFSVGNVIKQGIPVAITGKPNTGKSTLLNALLNEERAIVSEIPGTTRDAIEDTIMIGGYSFRFIDTAGLRETRDIIETLGIEKSREKIRDAVIILYVFDASAESWQEVAGSLSELNEGTGALSKKIILVGNKTDLLSELPRGFREFVDHETIFVSAKRKENLHMIAESLLNTVSVDNLHDGAIVSNTRHFDALQNALTAIRSVKQGFDAGLSSDLVTVDIHTALHHLGEITGEITTDEILGTIFSRFCIGK